jgi:hypothetical protein
MNITYQIIKTTIMSNNNGEWYNTFDATFWLSLSTALIAGLGVCLGYMFKSKCKSTNICWGMVVIERDVEAEVQEDTNDIERGLSRTGSIRRESMQHAML